VDVTVEHWNEPLGLSVFSVALLAGVAGMAIAQEKRGMATASPSRELWLFFSPGEARLGPDLRRAGDLLRHHPELTLRAALLSPDGSFLKKPSQDLADAVKALALLQGSGPSLRLWDDEGLSRARALGLTRFPAWALLGAPDREGLRHARVAVGYGPNLEELVR
jgi:hypothetical protein